MGLLYKPFHLEQLKAYTSLFYLGRIRERAWGREEARERLKHGNDLCWWNSESFMEEPVRGAHISERERLLHTISRRRREKRRHLCNEDNFPSKHSIATGKMRKIIMAWGIVASIPWNWMLRGNCVLIATMKGKRTPLRSGCAAPPNFQPLSSCPGNGIEPPWRSWETPSRWTALHTQEQQCRVKMPSDTSRVKSSTHKRVTMPRQDSERQFHSKEQHTQKRSTALFRIRATIPE